MTTSTVNSSRPTETAVHIAESSTPPAPPAASPLSPPDSIEIRENCCTGCITASARLVTRFFKAAFIELVGLCSYIYARLYVLVWTNHLAAIPNELEEDPFFSELMCPIGLTPIRFPVYDKNNLNHVYEKETILQHLAKRPFSPLTGEPMTPADLVYDVILQAKIEKHLHNYKNKNK